MEGPMYQFWFNQEIRVAQSDMGNAFFVVVVVVFLSLVIFVGVPDTHETVL